MKVSERIRQLRMVVKNADMPIVYRTILEQQIIQLEVDVVVALQTARQEAYQTGQTDGFNIACD